jgi:4-amino-4-deoxy-L-arabinose transferase-like glycosyltransferase
MVHEILLDARARMDALTLFGVLAVTAMMVCYALEQHSHWYTLGFSLACGLGSIYGFMQGAWPFGVVEAVWMMVALRKWKRVADGAGTLAKPPREKT